MRRLIRLFHLRYMLKHAENQAKQQNMIANIARHNEVEYQRRANILRSEIVMVEMQLTRPSRR